METLIDLTSKKLEEERKGQDPVPPSHWAWLLNMHQLLEHCMS